MHPRAPLYTNAYDLAAWLLERLGARPDVLSRESCRLALRLLDLVVLALKDRERWERLDAADEVLLALRQRIRLGRDRDLLDERQMLYALDLCDRIGRQIGGWQKALVSTE